MIKIQQKILTILLILVMVGRAIVPSVVVAQESTDPQTQTTTTQEEPKTPDSPKEPDAPKSPESPESPKTPESPKEPDAPKSPESPESPKTPESPKAPDKPKEPSKPSTDAWKPKPRGNYGGNTNSNGTQSTSSSTETNSNGNVGDTSIDTEDANNAATVTTNGNSNLASGNGPTGGSAGVVNSGNGAHSSNNSSASTTSSNNTNQNNSANVGNNVEQSSITGGNSTSLNVGDSSITTGDANVTGTVITSVNTNVDGVAVAEFNIADDHVGDIILDFGSNCIQGCTPGSLSATNSGNGVGSNNSLDASTTNNNTTNQTNDAYVGNNLDLYADSGNNTASFNTGGDSSITTGDANVSANVLTFANNNLAGNIIYGVVNIFGDLVGDIILTEEAMNAACGGNCYGQNTNAANTGNGAYSDNNASSTNTNNNNTFQSNDATINNNLVLDATTGDNDANFNTGGSSNVTTGNSSIDANVLNIANSNINGGNWWLVVVNEAGNWVGKLFGADENGNMAGSTGTEFVIDPATGAVTAKNNANGVGSDNTASTTNTNNNTTNQTNTAVIDNNINLGANTGGNKTSYNTGGDSNIVTGDAEVVANIVNFVNNNVSGGGKLLVTVVNVFGSWIGDFVTPGHEKAPSTAQNVGGSNNNSQNSSSNSSNRSKSENPNINVSITNSGNENVAFVGGATGDEDDFEGFGFGTVQGENTSGGNEATVVKTVGQDDSAAVAEKTLHINLAWLLLAFPMLVMVSLLRKSFVPVKTLALKGIHLFL